MPQPREEGGCTADGNRTGEGDCGPGLVLETGAGSAVMADPAAGEEKNVELLVLNPIFNYKTIRF
jgi:hypothetical protein